MLIATLLTYIARGRNQQTVEPLAGAGARAVSQLARGVNCAQQQCSPTPDLSHSQ